MYRQTSISIAAILLVVIMAAPTLAQFREIQRVNLQNFDIADAYGVATNHEDGLVYIMHLRQNTVVTFTEEFEEVGERLRLNGPQDIYGMDYNPADNTFWCADRMGNPRNIYHFDMDGEQLDVINPNNNANGVCYCSEDDHLYVACHAGGIVEMTIEGEILEVHNVGSLTAIDYYPPNGTLLVMDGGDNIFEYTLEGERVNQVQMGADIPGNGLGLDYDPWTRTLYTTWQNAGVQTWEDNYSALPEPEFDPENFEIVVPFGLEQEEVLTITNVGEEDSQLRYSIVDEGEGEVDWLEIDPLSGSLELDEAAEITLTVATIDLEPGDFERMVIVSTNNPEFMRFEIPFVITVIAGYGELRGTVTDAANDNPIEGAVVTVERFGFEAVSDGEGVYVFAEIPAWIYNLDIAAADYLPQHAEEVEVIEDETTVVGFDLLHSVCDLSIDVIDQSMQPNDELEIDFTLSNPGNGPLTWTLERDFGGGGNIEPWVYRGGFAAGDSVEDNRMGGIEFTGDNFYIGGGNSGADQNFVYIFDREGNYIDQFDQFAESRYGMRDLAWDGELLWGVDGNVVFGFTTDGQLQSELEAPVRSARSITWDRDRELLWISSVNTDIIGIDRNGEQVGVVDRPADTHIYGIAYFPEDTDGFNLYLFTGDGDYRQQVHKIDPESSESQLVGDLTDVEGARAGGLCITGLWDPYSWVFISMLDSPDIVGIWQLAPRTEWLQVDPVMGIVEPDGGTEITATLNTLGLPVEEQFEADIVFTHDGVDGVTMLPVRLEVTGVGGVSRRTLRFLLGWNMVSLNIDPTEHDVVELMQPLVDENLLALMKDSEGRFYNPEFGFNNIPGWNAAEGYQVKVEDNCDLTIEGEVIAWDAPIDLDEGWQIVSYYPRQAVDAIVALSGIVDNLFIAKDNLGHFYNVQFNFSNIGDLREGQAYQLKMNAEDRLVYTLEEGLFAGVEPNQHEPVHFGTPTPTGENMSVLVLEIQNPKSKIQNCELAAFNSSDLCVGVTALYGELPYGLAVWGDDPTTDEVDGLRDGEAFSLRMWQPGSDEEVDLEVESFISGSRLVYEADGFIALDAGVAVALPEEFYMQPAYPNPFNATTKVAFGLPEASPLTVKVYDLSGRYVTTLVSERFEAGHHEVAWDAADCVSGIYLVQIEAQGVVSVQKVTFMR